MAKIRSPRATTVPGVVQAARVSPLRQVSDILECVERQVKPRRRDGIPRTQYHFKVQLDPCQHVMTLPPRAYKTAVALGDPIQCILCGAETMVFKFNANTHYARVRRADGVLAWSALSQLTLPADVLLSDLPGEARSWLAQFYVVEFQGDFAHVEHKEHKPRTFDPHKVSTRRQAPDGRWETVLYSDLRPSDRVSRALSVEGRGWLSENFNIVDDRPNTYTLLPKG